VARKQAATRQPAAEEPVSVRFYCMICDVPIAEETEGHCLCRACYMQLPETLQYALDSGPEDEDGEHALYSLGLKTGMRIEFRFARLSSGAFMELYDARVEATYTSEPERFKAIEVRLSEIVWLS
jgi:hypothetical protein